MDSIPIPLCQWLVGFIGERMVQTSTCTQGHPGCQLHSGCASASP